MLPLILVTLRLYLRNIGYGRVNLMYRKQKYIFLFEQAVLQWSATCSSQRMQRYAHIWKHTDTTELTLKHFRIIDLICIHSQEFAVATPFSFARLYLISRKLITAENQKIDV